MKSFVLGFSRVESWTAIGSRVIQLIESRPFSHAYISYLDDDTDVEMIAQASHGYVNLVNYNIFKQNNTIIDEYIIECSDEDFKSILKFIDLNLGKEYSQIQLLWIGLKKLFHIEMNQDLNKDAAFICSEWASRICQIAGIEVPGDLDYVTPSDLHEIIIKLDIAKRVQ